MSIPTENWPKPFLLQCHEQAVEQGFVWVRPISEEDAASFRQRFYRIRRRSDSSMAAFIRPEYHLVMLGVWEPLQQPDGICTSCQGSGVTGPEPSQVCGVCNGQGNDTTLGQLPVIYDKRADGQDLPRIEAATGEDLSRIAAAPQLPATPLTSPPELNFPPEALKIDPAEVSNFVAGLRKKAKQ